MNDVIKSEMSVQYKRMPDVCECILIQWALCNTCFLQVPEGKVVVLSFRFLDLESDNLCRYDYVDVYSGHANGQRLGRFCGTFKPGALVSTSSKMLLQMVSDANTAGSGFLAVYSAVNPNERGKNIIKLADNKTDFCSTLQSQRSLVDVLMCLRCLKFNG